MTAKKYLSLAVSLCVVASVMMGGLLVESRAAHFTAFGPTGEGGSLNGQTFEIGPGGSVFALDAFVRIAGEDLNGANVGTSAQLSTNLLPAGLTYSFTSALSTDATDVTLIYHLTNTSVEVFTNVVFYILLDVEIDEASNTFFNELGELTGHAGSGALDPDPDAWEIDEPGFETGDLVDHLLLGSLENANNIPLPGAEDVAMALGFELGDLRSSDEVLIEILISEDGDFIGSLALHQHDQRSDPDTEITLSGQATVLHLADAPPVAVCQDIEVALDEIGQVTITASEVDGGSFDPEEESLTLSIDQTAFSCSDVGANTVRLTVTDPQGQSDSCEATITVVDAIAPVALCKEFTVSLVSGTSSNTIPSVQFISPAAGESPSNHNVRVTFTTFNHVVGGQGESHIHFHLDGSGDHLMFYNGLDEVVEFNQDPGATPLASWINPTTIQFNNLSEGVHTVRAHLASSSHGTLGNAGADVTIAFNVATNAPSSTPSVQIHSPEGGETFPTGEVQIEFETFNHLVGGKGASHIHFHLDGSADHLMFYNGLDEVVEFSQDPGPTPLASWISPTTVEFNNLSNGVHTIRAHLATSSHGTLGNAESDVTIAFNVRREVELEAFISASDIDDGSSDACGLASLSVSPERVTCAEVGEQPVTLTVTDVNGNTSSCTGIVTVVDSNVPEILLLGANPQVIECSTAYTELGASASDLCEGDVSGSIVIDASGVDTATPGSYTVTYDVTDGSGNAAAQVTRTVVVEDTTSPALTLTGVNPQVIECSTAYTELGATANDLCEGDLTRIVHTF